MSESISKSVKLFGQVQTVTFRIGIGFNAALIEMWIEKQQRWASGVETAAALFGQDVKPLEEKQ